MALPLLLIILIAVIIVSAISLIGALSLFFQATFLKKSLHLLVSFAAGALLGAAFLDLLPEALELADVSTAFFYVLVGIIVFFVMETFLYWYHCHNGKCDVHAGHKHHKAHHMPFTYLNLVGDGIHNFVDGMIIATSFLVNVPLGIVTTAAVAFHEIPQELGDFGLLIYGGFTRAKALLYNFLSAITSVAGALIAYYFSTYVQNFNSFLIPFAAGGFIYIAGADLLPELHRERELSKTTMQLGFLLFGIAIIWLFGKLFAN